MQGRPGCLHACPLTPPQDLVGLTGLVRVTSRWHGHLVSCGPRLCLSQVPMANTPRAVFKQRIILGCRWPAWPQNCSGHAVTLLLGFAINSTQPLFPPQTLQGSIPAPGTGIPHAAWRGQKMEKRKNLSEAKLQFIISPWSVPITGQDEGMFAS